MATFNSCQFIGRLGKDPDFTVTPAGKPVAKFSLAIDQGKDHPAMWLNVVAWERLAEIIERYAAKGMQVFVVGRLQCRAYDDRNGVKRQAIDLIASTIQLLDKRENPYPPISKAAASADEEMDPFLSNDEIP